MLFANITLHGHVQGVGFRMYAHDIATNMGIFGNIKNHYDGTVIIHAYANEKKTLDEFIDKIKIGPKYSSISKVEITFTTSDPPLEEGFDVQT